MEQPIVIFILIIGVILLMGFVGVRNATETYQRVLKYLQDKGMTDIIVKGQTTFFDRDTLTYSVEYTDAQGQRHQNSCKIRIDFLGDSFNQPIYWKDPL